MDRRDSHVIDKGDHGFRVRTGGHVSIAGRWRQPEAAEIHRIAVHFVAHAEHEVGPIQGRTTEPMDEHGGREVGTLRAAHMEGAVREDDLRSREWTWRDHVVRVRPHPGRWRRESY